MKKLMWTESKERNRGPKSPKCHFSKYGWSLCFVIEILQEILMFFK